MNKTIPAPARRHGAARVRRLCAALLLAAVLPATAQTGPASPAAPAPPADKAGLNFVNADIDSVVAAVGQYTNTTFILDPRVRGTINLVSDGPVTRRQAMRLLTSALRLQGYAVVPGDGFSKVVPEADAKLQAASTQSPLRGDQIATQIFHLNYESAPNLVPMLRPLISPNNAISADPTTNTLMVTDYGDNLRRIGKIIASLDLPAASEPEIIPIHYAMATDIAVMLNRLMEPSTPGGGPNAAQGNEAGRLFALADPRTNSVILRAPSIARANLAKTLIAKLDLPTAQPGNVHVVPLKNAEAIELAKTLRAVVLANNPNARSENAVQQAQTPSQPPQQQNAATNTNTAGTTTASDTTQSGDNSTQMNNGPLNNQPKERLPTGGPAGFIQADPATNSLIITASEPVYRNLRRVIDQLDVRRAQVYVESLIVEVTSDKAAEFGIQWLGASGNANSRYRVGGITGFTTPGSGSNLISQAVSTAAGGALQSPGNGLTLGVVHQSGGQMDLGVIARALQSDADTNILSMPNLVTLDNEEARIIVGQNVPFITGEYTTTASGSSNPFQTIEREDVGLSLRIRPQISEGNTVRMQIYQEDSSIQPTTTGTAADIITNKRSVETNVVVNDGQIIVLGGLLEDSVSDSEEKVPGLGDIPVLGNLFKYRSRSRTKTNLMIFLRPIILRSNDQSVDVSGDRYDMMRSIEATTKLKPSWIAPDNGVPVMPPLENGQPQGGQLARRPAPLLEPALQRVSERAQGIVPTAPNAPLNLPAAPAASPPPAPPATHEE